jgi:hypothetical protein
MIKISQPDPNGRINANNPGKVQKVVDENG